METEDLIESLASAARPIVRLRPPLLRAGLWLLAIAAVAAAAILLFADLGLFATRTRNIRWDIEMAGTLLTGIMAVIAAFYLSLPDRPRAWALVPLPFLALWVGASSYSCYVHWLNFGPDGWTIGESAHCFAFILGASLPLGVALFLLLRRAKPLAPIGVAAVGGLGVAGLAAFILQFFHPFDVTTMDLAIHLVAVGTVVLLAAVVGVRDKSLT